MVARRWSAAAVVRALHSKELQQSEKGALRAAVTNALWTRTRLRRAGYVVPEGCQLCGQRVEDDLEHRVWRCPATADLRQSKEILATRSRGLHAGLPTSVFGTAYAHTPRR